MNKPSFSHLLLIYGVTVLLISLITFLGLLIGFYIPAVRELSSPMASTPGVGLLLAVYAQFSALVGLIAAIPATWLLTRLIRLLSTFRQSKSS